MKMNRNLIAALVTASFLAFVPSVLAVDAAAPAKQNVQCKCATAPCAGCKTGQPCKCKMHKKACPAQKNLKKGEACVAPCAGCKKEDKKMASPAPKKEK